jgi:hypothetical protein
MPTFLLEEEKAFVALVAVEYATLNDNILLTP